MIKFPLFAALILATPSFLFAEERIRLIVPEEITGFEAFPVAVELHPSVIKELLYDDLSYVDPGCRANRRLISVMGEGGVEVSINVVIATGGAGLCGTASQESEPDLYRYEFELDPVKIFYVGRRFAHTDSVTIIYGPIIDPSDLGVRASERKIVASSNLRIVTPSHPAQRPMSRKEWFEAANFFPDLFLASLDATDIEQVEYTDIIDAVFVLENDELKFKAIQKLGPAPTTGSQFAGVLSHMRKHPDGKTLLSYVPERNDLSVRLTLLQDRVIAELDTDQAIERLEHSLQLIEQQRAEIPLTPRGIDAGRVREWDSRQEGTKKFLDKVQKKEAEEQQLIFQLPDWRLEVDAPTGPVSGKLVPVEVLYDRPEDQGAVRNYFSLGEEFEIEVISEPFAGAFRAEEFKPRPARKALELWYPEIWQYGLVWLEKGLEPEVWAAEQVPEIRKWKSWLTSYTDDQLLRSVYPKLEFIGYGEPRRLDLANIGTFQEPGRYELRLIWKVLRPMNEWEVLMKLASEPFVILVTDQLESAADQVEH